jgi:acyl carrier protein
MTNQERIRQFIVTNFYVAEADKLADDTSFLDKGIIDSTGVLEVVSFLEQEFGITIEDGEMVPENLDSIGGLVAMVDRKKKAAG